MTIEEAQKIIKTTNSPYLKRDMEKFIRRQKKNAPRTNRGAKR
nr:MAG TPA: hypothetical protein [Caudoviricetes sp.]